MPRETRCIPAYAALAVALILSLGSAAPAADLVELLSGARMRGRILKETDDQVVMMIRSTHGSAQMRIAKERIHAITSGGERRVINKKPDPPPRKPVRKPAMLKTSKKAKKPKPAATGILPFGWRGDGTGRFPSTNPPTRWGDNENILWKTPMPARSNASPIVVGKYVYCLAEPHTLVCVSRRDGKIVWQKANPPQEVLGADHEDPGEFDGLRGWTCQTPISDGTNIWASFGQGMVICFDMDGNRVWAQPINTQINYRGEQAYHGVDASPLLVGDMLVLQTNSGVTAFDARRGAVAWNAGVGSAMAGTMTVMQLGGKPHLVLPKGHLVRAGDGKVLVGDQSGKGWKNWGPSAVVEDDVAVLHFHGRPANMTVIRAYRYTANGEVTKLWEFTPEPEHNYFTRMGNTHLIDDGLVYAVTDGGHLQVLDVADGKLVYEHKWGKHSYSSLVKAGPFVYATGKKVVHVFRAGRTFQPVADFGVGFLGYHKYPWLTIASPIFVENTMIFRDREHLYCIGAASRGGRARRR